MPIPVHKLAPPPLPDFIERSPQGERGRNPGDVARAYRTGKLVLVPD